MFVFHYVHIETRGPGSSVGIATDYLLDGPGSNSGGDEVFPPFQTAPGAHPASYKMGTGSFPEVKCGLIVLLTTHPPPRAEVKERVELYLYPPFGPHRACNRITLPFYLYLLHGAESFLSSYLVCS